MGSDKVVKAREVGREETREGGREEAREGGRAYLVEEVVEMGQEHAQAHLAVCRGDG